MYNGEMNQSLEIGFKFLESRRISGRNWKLTRWKPFEWKEHRSVAVKQPLCTEHWYHYYSTLENALFYDVHNNLYALREAPSPKLWICIVDGEKLTDGRVCGSKKLMIVDQIEFFGCNIGIWAEQIAQNYAKRLRGWTIGNGGYGWLKLAVVSDLLRGTDVILPKLQCPSGIDYQIKRAEEYMKNVKRD